MLHSLRLRNFRAYRQQQFDFARINIFVGKNSSGKSSAISAINFLAQSFASQSDLDNPLIFNGPYEGLGTFVDIVHGNRASSPIEIEFIYGREREYNVSFTMKYRKQRREVEIAHFKLDVLNEPTYEYELTNKGYEIRFQGRRVEDWLPRTQKMRPVFHAIFPSDRHLMRANLPSSARRDAAEPTNETQEVLRQVDGSMRSARFELGRLFRNFDTLSPFRDPPQRTYLYTGEVPGKIGRTGSNGISLLANDQSRRGRASAQIVSQISRWLKVTGIASGIEVRPLTQRHFEICVLDLDGKRHNICDVGFGCSQVLPVLVGSLNAFGNRTTGPRGPIFVVQEPEIHLHPNAQAALGSFFVSLSKNRGQLFIETHSDHLLLRIARHVALGHINHNDVAIFFCENEDGIKSAKRIKLDELAVFEPSWPGGFFPQREAEVLAIAKARTLPASQKKDLSQLDFFYPEK